ncbi:MAG: FtsQ-type POTRA domain-containing protein [Desulfovibrio sp.]|nr:FtsQ-type POTRA domain-containing protein [Desulfovibrio sp.]
MPLVLKKSGRKNRNTFMRVPTSAGAENRHGGIRILQKVTQFAAHIGAARGLKNFAVVVLILAAMAGILGGICYASLWLYGVAVTSDFFTTRHVDISGNVRLTREMVLDYGGIHEGDNCLAVSIAKVEMNLRRTPWVEEVSVKRLLPDRFVIKLKERLPSFWVHKDGVLYYANELGETIAPVESRNFLSLPTLRISPGAEDAIPYLKRLMQGIRNGMLPVEMGAVSSVTVSPGNGIELYLEDREMRLSVATDDWDGNIVRLGVALGDLVRRHELQNVREIRSVNGNVWVQFNRPA